MRISIVVIFILAIDINIPDWTTIAIERREDGRIRGYDTVRYGNMPQYYHFYAVRIPITILLLLHVFFGNHIAETKKNNYNHENLHGNLLCI